MDPHSGIGDPDFERVLGGHGPSRDEELEDVKRFVRNLRECYPRDDVDPSVETVHLAAMMEAAGALTGDPVKKARGQDRQLKGGARQAVGDVKNAGQKISRGAKKAVRKAS